MRRAVRIVQQISFSLIIKFLSDFFLNLGFALFRPKMNWCFYKHSLTDDWIWGNSLPGVSPRAIISRPFRA